MIIITVTVEFDLKCQMISSHLKTTFAFNILQSFDTSSVEVGFILFLDTAFTVSTTFCDPHPALCNAKHATMFKQK